MPLQTRNVLAAVMLHCLVAANGDDTQCLIQLPRQPNFARKIFGHIIGELEHQRNDEVLVVQQKPASDLIQEESWLRADHAQAETAKSEALQDWTPLLMRAGGALLAMVVVFGFVWVCTHKIQNGAVDEATEVEGELAQLEQARSELETKLQALDRSLEEQPPDDMSDEQFKARIDRATVNAAVQWQSGLENSLLAASPVCAKALRAEKAWKDGLDDAKAKATEHVTTVGVGLLHKVLSIVGLDDSFIAPLMSLKGLLQGQREFEAAKDGSSPSMPLPLPLFIAGLFAPLQLRFVLSWHSGLLAFSKLLLLILTGVMVFDFGLTCGSDSSWYWAYGMLGIMLVAVLCRISIVNTAEGELRDIRRSSVEFPDFRDAKSLVQQMRDRVISCSGDFFRALHARERARNCLGARLLSSLNMVFFVWGGVGVYLSIWYVVEDDTCDAGALRLTMHVFSFVYIAVFVWSVFFLVAWLVTRWASNVVLGCARRLDAEICMGLPLASLIVRVFVLNDLADLAQADASDLHGSIDDLRQQQEDLQKETAQIEAALESKQQQLEAAALERMEDGARTLAEEALPAVPSANIEEMALRALQLAREAGVDVHAVAAKVQSENTLRQAGQSS